ncbi:MAG: hypothetical protein SWK90_17580 [Chloroflexota bacterium]|nr:hypothetical protein [Chloroflexota bacterium]
MSRLSSRQAAFVIGLVVGLVLGLVYTWGIAPVELVNTYPALLRTDYRWDWIRLVALSYVADGDLERARARLDGLEQEDVAGAMRALIEEHAAAGRPADALRRLSTLADALDVHTPAMLVYLHITPTSQPYSTPTASLIPTLSPTPLRTPTPTPHSISTSTLSPTPTLKPTRTPRPPTPTPTPLSPFRLVQQEQICDPGQAPHIEVVVRDERGLGLDGVVVWLMWPGGADRAVTGLKPQQGAGYVDFDAGPGVSEPVDYALGIGELGLPLVTDLRIEPCPARKGKEPLLGSWRIVLEQQSRAAE